MSFYEYSANYVPAMPICQIYLGPINKEPTFGPFEALLDTGADVAVIPLKYLRQVRAKRTSQGRARSVWGDSQMVSVYTVSLALNGLRFQALEVLADADGDEIILGRFVLNRLKIVLDGPAAFVEIVGS
jgi:predicted aspartyl protease